MQTPQRMVPRFIFRKASRDTAPLNPNTVGRIWLRLNVNGHRKPVTTGVSCRYGDWDAKAQAITGRSAAVQQLNKQLESFKVEARERFDELKAGGRRVSPNLLKNAVKGEAQACPTLLKLADDFIASRGGQRADATLTHYGTYRKTLADFIADTRQRGVLAEEVNNRFAVALHDYLTAQGHGNAWGNKVVRFVSQVLKHGLRTEALDRNALAAFEYPHAEEPKPRPLDDDQLGRLIAVRPLLPSQALIDAATCFLFGCYTGLAYVDLLSFRRSQRVAGGWLSGRRQKTGKPYGLPWLPICDALLGGADALPLTSNPQYNLLLKVIAAAANLPPDLSSHVARHTFVRLVRSTGLSGKEYELATGDSAKVLRKHYEQAEAATTRAAFAKLAPPRSDVAQRVARLLSGAEAVRPLEPWLE